MPALAARALGTDWYADLRPEQLGCRVEAATVVAEQGDHVIASAKLLLVDTEVGAYGILEDWSSDGTTEGKSAQGAVLEASMEWVRDRWGGGLFTGPGLDTSDKIYVEHGFIATDHSGLVLPTHPKERAPES
jgi:hypothetical protein